MMQHVDRFLPIHSLQSIVDIADSLIEMNDCLDPSIEGWRRAAHGRADATIRYGLRTGKGMTTIAENGQMNDLVLTDDRLFGLAAGWQAAGHGVRCVCNSHMGIIAASGGQYDDYP